jgi:peptide/nickel transport system substrate-binding protein
VVLTRSGRCLSLILLVALVLGACDSAVPSPSAPSGTGRAGSSPAEPGPTATSAAAGSPAPDATSYLTEYAPAAGKDGGTVVIGDWQEANQFHPYFVSQPTDARVASATWATLVTMTGDGRYAPDLAASIPTTGNGAVRVPGDDSDAMTVDWKIRDGLKWSDGEPLTCDDFKYAWEWVTDPANVGVVTSGFENITRFECNSTTDMVWRFDRVYAGYLTLMTAPLPRHYLAAISVEDQAAGAGFRAAEVPKLPVSGPFAFAAVNPGSDLRLVRNPGYTSWATGKPARLDALTWRWYPDVDSLIAAFRKGDIRVATNLEASELPKVKNLGDRVSAVPAMAYEALRPNWSPSTCSVSVRVLDRGLGCPMSDPAMRRAVALAVDRTALSGDLPGGGVPITGSAVSPTLWFHADPAPVEFDPTKARAVLDAGGWQRGADGLRRKDGLAARIEVCTTTGAEHEGVVGRIVPWLKDVGIDAIPNVVSADEMFADEDTATKETQCALARGSFDVAAQTLSSPVDPLGAFFAYHGSQVSPSGTNEAMIQDPALDAVLETVQGSADIAAIGSAMAEFQRLYVEEAVEIPLYFRRDVELVDRRLVNFVANAGPGGSTWNVADWALK